MPGASPQSIGTPGGAPPRPSGFDMPVENVEGANLGLHGLRGGSRKKDASGESRG
jgi:hypothetical protein